MKKFLVTIVLCLLWCNTTYGLGDQEIIDKYLSERKLDFAEGLWKTKKGKTFVIYKIKNEFFIQNETTKKCGEITKIFKESVKVFKYSSYGFEDINSCDKTSDLLNLRLIFSHNENVGEMIVYVNDRYQNKIEFSRLWPDNIIYHNENFKTEEDIKNEEKKLQELIKKTRKTCNVLGFELGSEKFNNCVLKLYVKKLEEEGMRNVFISQTHYIKKIYDILDKQGLN